MGFWGSLGKGLLKVAPVAAAFIPGVGPLASMGISAAIKGATKKIQGGTWKQALGAGALGAAEGLGAKGIGASGGMLSKITGNIGKVMNPGGVSGWQGALGNTLKGGLDMMGQGQQQYQQPQMAQQSYQQPPMASMPSSMTQRRGLAPSFAAGAAQARSYA